jgi:hypothetical protein
LSSQSLKPEKVLPPETVKQFYLSDETSRIMPGALDHTSVKSEGKMVCLQK